MVLGLNAVPTYAVLYLGDILSSLKIGIPENYISFEYEKLCLQEFLKG